MGAAVPTRSQRTWDTPSLRRRADLNRGGGTAILASPSPSSFRRDPQTMQMTGQYRIEAPRQAVWEALNDVEVLRQRLPGFGEIATTSDTYFPATVRATAGPGVARL